MALINWRHYLQELKSSHSTPHEIALGFAIGTFIGVLPTPFISVILAFFVLFLYPKMSKLSLFFAILLWNPFITVPLSVISYRIGDLIFGTAPVVTFDVTIWDSLVNLTRRYLLGSVILSASISVASYVLTYLAALWWKTHHR